MTGKILGGRYELLEKIGIGGMAIVYRAKCLLLNRTVAVKVLRDDLDSSDEFLKRFNIEAQSAASLTNQHIVSIYDVGKDGNVNYIVMEYVEGETLKEYIKEQKMIEWKEAVRIAMGIADALSEAHKKHIIHRDIKPHNVIVTNEGDIKVTDFGIARVSSGATISVDGDVLGSVHYLSPEQARGGYVDERSDIYSLGIVMYEMLTGKVPFDGDTPVAVAMKQIEQPPVPPTELVSGIPQNVSNIVLKAMCKETSGRYATVTELFDDLSKVLADPDSAVIDTNDNNDVMDEATKKIPALKIDNMILDIESGKMVKDVEKTAPPANKKAKKMDKNDKRAIIGAVATSLVIVILLSVFAASMIFPDFKPFGFLGAFSNREVEVPKLIDLTLEQAEDLIKDTDFSIVVQGDETSGVITEQYPHPGRRVKGSYSIEVVLGDGGEAIKLKDYRNKDYKNAENELRKLGIDVVIERQNSDDIAIDHIISQSPGKNASLKKGDTVTLFVSDGVSDGEIVVPNFVGMSKNDAKRRIEQENLVVGTFDYADSSKPKDTVIKQSINAGDSAKEKDVINLVLSNGQGGGNENSGSSEKKSRILTYYLPTDKTEVTVKLTENGKKIYEGIAYPKKNSVFEYSVNGPADAVYEFYVDGKKLGN